MDRNGKPGYTQRWRRPSRLPHSIVRQEGKSTPPVAQDGLPKSSSIALTLDTTPIGLPSSGVNVTSRAIVPSVQAKQSVSLAPSSCDLAGSRHAQPSQKMSPGFCTFPAEAMQNRDRTAFHRQRLQRFLSYGASSVQETVANAPRTDGSSRCRCTSMVAQQFHDTSEQERVPAASRFLYCLVSALCPSRCSRGLGAHRKNWCELAFTEFRRCVIKCSTEAFKRITPKNVFQPASHLAEVCVVPQARL